MNNPLFQALWFIVIFCLSSVLIHESVRKREMAKLSSDISKLSSAPSKTKEHTFDNFYLAVSCFSISFLMTTALLQWYINCREIVKLTRRMEIDAEKYSRTPLTKDWLDEIKDPSQETV